jgi:hypothetical protein
MLSPVFITLGGPSAHRHSLWSRLGRAYREREAVADPRLR